MLGDRRRGPRRTCSRMLEQLEVHVGETPQPDRVQVATPEAIRARRFEVVFVLRAPGGRVPRAAPRRSRSCPTRTGARSPRASGLVLPVREDRLDRERYLFYVCASRAERLLVLSSRSSDEEGNPADRVLLRGRRARPARADGAELRARSLSDVTWSAGGGAHRGRVGPRARRRRARAGRCRGPGPLTRRPLLEELAARDAVAARALENFADCPVKWLVEDLLRPDELVPDPEAMVRGSYAHDGARAHLRAPARGDRRPARHPRQPRPTPSASCWRSCASAARSSSSRRSRRACAPRRAGSSSTCCATCARRPTRTARFEPVELEREFGFGDDSEPVELDGGPARARPDRPRGRAATAWRS